MDKTKELVQVLKRLNSGESIDQVKQDAQELLASIDATELSIAEQQLIENGMKPEDLRGLCSIHMSMLEGELDRMKSSVEPGHPVHTFIAEHDVLLGLLQELERLNHRIQQEEVIDPHSDEIQSLVRVATGLVDAEKHHAREEDALFPAMEQAGVNGPPTVMRLEHNDLRPRKKQLLELAEKAASLEPDYFKTQLDTLAKHIVFNLRDHIFKENHILYPTALEVLSDDSVWKDIKAKCDKIGYCPFSPKSA